MTTKVLVADDQPVIRKGFSLFLRGDPNIEVIGEASTGTEAVELTLKKPVDVILMDVRMPKGNGLWASKVILERRSNVHIIIMTTFDLDAYLFEALDIGASGFLLKDSNPDRLIDAIHTVVNGGCAVSDSLVGRLVSELTRRKNLFAKADTPSEQKHGLTDREIEVVKLLAEGLSNREIANRLYLEISTVKAHIGKIVVKLDLKNRVQIAIWAFAHGIATPHI